ncbi:MAG TPA: AtpZ/AtpI family protein [Candidatus Saccharimonadales bacterium]|nr:AtpZ/AtpI family protein [Candidatus Saccharimonadales bacterium]
MGRVSTKPKAPSSASNKDEIARLAAAATSKQQFVNSAMDMGWRMAISVIVPVIIGSWLDHKYHTSPSWTLVSLFVAVTLAVMVVMKTIKDLNNSQTNRKAR